jgi:type II secretory pathway component PulF
MLDVLLQVGARDVRPALLGLVLNTLSVGLLLALLVIFATTWRKTKAPFALGLVVFSGVLLVQDLVRVARVLGVLARPGVEFVPDVLEVLALVVLLYLATR